MWVALFAWVFALAAGVANACLVTLPGSAPAGHENHPHVHESAAHGPASAVLADDEGEYALAHPHQAQADPAKASCLKFCDDESSVLVKSGSPWFDWAPADTLLGGLPIQPAPLTDARERRSLAGHHAQGPPLVIRLLRLTL